MKKTLGCADTLNKICICFFKVRRFGTLDFNINPNVHGDPGSGNEKFNNHYVSCGFTKQGVVELKNNDSLPEH